jgi:hypothetical protein
MFFAHVVPSDALRHCRVRICWLIHESYPPPYRQECRKLFHIYLYPNGHDPSLHCIYHFTINTAEASTAICYTAHVMTKYKLERCGLHVVFGEVFEQSLILGNRPVDSIQYTYITLNL